MLTRVFACALVLAGQVQRSECIVCDAYVLLTASLRLRTVRNCLPHGRLAGARPTVASLFALGLRADVLLCGAAADLHRDPRLGAAAERVCRQHVPTALVGRASDSRLVAPPLLRSTIDRIKIHLSAARRALAGHRRSSAAAAVSHSHRFTPLRCCGTDISRLVCNCAGLGCVPWRHWRTCDRGQGRVLRVAHRGFVCPFRLHVPYGCAVPCDFTAMHLYVAFWLQSRCTIVTTNFQLARLHDPGIYGCHGPDPRRMRMRDTRSSNHKI